MRKFLSLTLAALSLFATGCASSHDYYDHRGYRYEHNHGYEQRYHNDRYYQHDRRAEARYYREREREEAAHRRHHAQRYTRNHGRDRDDDHHDHRR